MSMYPRVWCFCILEYGSYGVSVSLSMVFCILEYGPRVWCFCIVSSSMVFLYRYFRILEYGVSVLVFLYPRVWYSVSSSMVFLYPRIWHAFKYGYTSSMDTPSSTDIPSNMDTPRVWIYPQVWIHPQIWIWIHPQIWIWIHPQIWIQIRIQIRIHTRYINLSRKAGAQGTCRQRQTRWGISACPCIAQPFGRSVGTHGEFCGGMQVSSWNLFEMHAFSAATPGRAREDMGCMRCAGDPNKTENFFHCRASAEKQFFQMECSRSGWSGFSLAIGRDWVSLVKISLL
jgi:hypothetical protein